MRQSGLKTNPRPASRVRGPIHAQVLPHIRRHIVLNRWQPGERLPEMGLCAEFGISRTPLRDVLKILEIEGFVDLQPHVGAVITRMDPQDIAERFEVMTALERLAAMKLARAQPEPAIQEIQRLHRAMARAARETRVALYYRLNDAFHRTIVLGCANAALCDMHETLMFHVSRARNHANEHEPLVESAFEHHGAIVRAIAAGDAEAAGQAMAGHLEEVTRIVLRALEMRVMRPS